MASSREYQKVMMLTAVVSALAHIAAVLIEIGRSAAWWR
jgi:hypothetical protein